MRLPLLYASSNAGKIREVSSLLSDEGIELHVPADLGLALDVPETADTLEGNAELKARAYRERAPDHGEHHRLPAERKRHLSTHRARAVKAAVRRVHELGL